MTTIKKSWIVEMRADVSHILDWIINLPLNPCKLKNRVPNVIETKPTNKRKKHTALRLQSNHYWILFSHGGRITNQALCLFMNYLIRAI